MINGIAVTPELFLVFTTPLMVRTVPSASEINEGLERTVLARRQREQGNRFSNIGGWQSAPDLLEWPEPEVKLLIAEIDRAVQQVSALPAILETQHTEGHKRVTFRASGWANVNQNGHYNALHIHTNYQWSVVYYVATGTPATDHPLNGCLELRDPRPTARFGEAPGYAFGHPLTIPPAPGLLVVFPAWLEHWVHPFYGEGHRISLAFNVAIDSN